MKKLVILVLLIIVESFEKNIGKLKDFLSPNVNVESKQNFYSDLMPKDASDKVETYHKALDWAIYDNLRIRNIALSGPYGSGKSTIIESYIKKHNTSKDKFLKISLATFCEDKTVNLKKQQFIEKSILEQMIYRVDGKKTPFSRFKKINKVSRTTVWKSLIIFCIFFISGGLLYNIKFISKAQDLFNKRQITLEAVKSKCWIIILSIVFACTLVILLYHLTNLLFKGFKVANIKFANAEIKIVGNNIESIYNKYLDELLYFFEETQYEIVVFEDIDRFKNPAIFTNLREINNFLYNYEKINRRIVFLYAIKDDMFSNKDRTKFFDFIIPVIPFVDAFNSRQIVLNMFEHINKSGIRIPSKRLIKDITIFLDDMRMLTNIINEYLIYYKQINNDKIDADKLFSIIVYKNLMPKDFSELQYNGGIVKKVFNKKAEFVEKEIKKIEEKINLIRKSIEVADAMFVNSVEDLQIVFAHHWNQRGITQIHTNVANSVQLRMNEDIVGRKNDFNKEEMVRVNINNNTSNLFNYDDIFTAFGLYDNLFTMAESIKLKSLENMQKAKLLLKENINRKSELKLISLQDLIVKYDNTEILDEIKSAELLIFLIREGHIDETYRHYISHFYPGAITQEDMDFLRSVKNNTELSYEYKLEQVNEIIKDISVEELRSKSVLNNNLIEYLLDNLSKEKGRFDIIIEGLIKDIAIRIDFVDQFCEKSIFREAFIYELCKIYTQFWDFIINKSKFDPQKIDDYFTWIMNTCDIEVIIKMNEGDCIKNFIESTAHILQFKYKGNVEEKLKVIFVKLNVKFRLLEKPEVETSLKNEQKLENKLILYSLENNLYKINESMITYFYGYLVEFDEDGMKMFETKNYSSIKMLQNKCLNNYVDSNLIEYLTEVFLKLSQNTEEDILVISDLLENNDINEDIKIKIINKSNFIIHDISIVPNELWNTIVDCTKLEITWLNVICYFEHFNKISTKIIEQLNDRGIYENLSITMINEAKGTKKITDDAFKRLYRYLYENEDLSDECFSKIQKVIPVDYNYSDTIKISPKRVNLILFYNRMRITEKDLLWLKNNYNELYYKWSIENFDKFLDETKEPFLVIDDIIMYLGVGKVGVKNKVKLLNSYKESIINNLNNTELVEQIFKLNRKRTVIGIKYSIFEALMKLENYNEERVCLLANRVKELNPNEIRKYLELLGEPLNELSISEYQELSSIEISNRNSIKYLLQVLFDCKYVESYEETDKGYDIKVHIEKSM